MAAELFLKQAVVSAFAVGGIADDRMGDVFEVPAQLVAASGFRFEFKQGVATRRIAINPVGKFNRRQAPVAGDCVLRFAAAIWCAEFVVVVLTGERMVDRSGRLRNTANDSQIGLVDLLCFELRAQQATGIAVECKEQDTRSAAVQTMHRMHMLTDLVAQDLHGKACFVTIKHRAVNQQPGRLVDGDQVIVTVEDWQFLLHVFLLFSGNSPST